MLSEILGELGWNTYMVGKWHLCPTDEMNLASTRRNWPSGRGFERWYGFLGAETNQWYPDLVYDNHPVDQPKAPDEGYHLTEDITDKALEFIRDAKAVTPDKPFFLYYAPGACHAPHHAPREWIDKFKGQFDMGYEAIRETTLANQIKLGIVPADTELPPVNPIGTQDAHGPGRQAVPDARRHAPVGLAQRRREAPVLAHGGGLRRLPRARRLPHRPPARLPRRVGHARQHDDRPRVRQRRQRRGRPERLGQRDEVRQRRPRRPGAEPRPDRRPRRHEDLQPLPERLGDGLQHAVQDVEAVRVQRRHRRPVHHLLARRDQGPRRGPRPVRHAIDIVPTILDVLGVEPPETLKGHTQSHDRRRHACGRASTTAPRRRAARRSSTRCSARARSGTRAGRP